MFFSTEVFVRVEWLFYSRTLPDWVPAHWWSLTDMLIACQINDKADFMTDLVGAVIVGLGALAFAVNWLFGGVRSVVSFLNHGSGESPETELSLSSTLREGLRDIWLIVIAVRVPLRHRESILVQFENPIPVPAGRTCWYCRQARVTRLPIQQGR